MPSDCFPLFIQFDIMLCESCFKSILPYEKSPFQRHVSPISNWYYFQWHVSLNSTKLNGWKFVFPCKSCTVLLKLNYTLMWRGTVRLGFFHYWLSFSDSSLNIIQSLILLFHLVDIFHRSRKGRLYTFGYCENFECFLYCTKNYLFAVEPKILKT